MFDKVNIIRYNDTFTLKVLNNSEWVETWGLSWPEVLEHLDPKKRRGTAERFEEFWKAYPAERRIAKKRCVEIWKRKRLDNHIEDILQGVLYHINTDQWRNGYIQNASTYLNQNLWEDRLETIVSEPAKKKLPPRVAKILLSGVATALFPGEDRPETIYMKDWDYGDQIYLGLPGFRNKVTGELLALSDYT